MRFTDHAILLSVTKYSESTAICRFFAQQNGIISGAVRGAMSRKQKGNYQQGNLAHVEWSARLAEHLGSLKCEFTSPISAYFLNDALRLSALNAALALTQASLAEHDPHPQLFDCLQNLLEKLKHNDTTWMADYARFELLLLEESGFRLELERCAVTGETENLIYVSPNSGCAVTAQTGEPYKHKLLPLPAFLTHSSNPCTPHMLAQAMQLTGYFLEHRLFASHSKPMPLARMRFENNLNKLLQSSALAAKQAV